MSQDFQKSEIAAHPRHMKINVSQIWDIIFIPYLTVVWLFADMLCSTYEFMVKAQNTIARIADRPKHSAVKYAMKQIVNTNVGSIILAFTVYFVMKAPRKP